MANFLLEFSGFLACVLLVYRAFLYREKRYNVSRFILLFGLIFSLVIPFIEYSKEGQLPHMGEFNMEEVYTNSNSVPLTPVIEAESENSTLDLSILFNIWIIGIIAFGFRFFYNLIRIINLIFSKRQGHFIVVDQASQPVSFFNYIIVNSLDLPSEVLAHEQMHGKLKHSYDILLVEIFIVLFWWNPLVYILKNFLRQLHELQVDHLLLTSDELRINPENYFNLILFYSRSKSAYAMVNTLNFQPLKNRITMFTKPKSKKSTFFISLITSLSLLAAISFSFTLNSKASLYTTSLKGKHIVLDAGHGGKDNGVIANGQNEGEINLKLCNILKQKLEAKGAKVTMTRRFDVFLELKERCEISENINADFFFSIHANSDEDASKRGAEIYFFKDETEELAKNLSTTLRGKHQLLNSVSYKKAPFWVLKMNKTKGLLFESGFMTNQEDIKLLTDEKELEKLATQLSNGLSELL